MSVSPADANEFLVRIARAADHSIHVRVKAEALFESPKGVPPGLYQLSMAKFLESERLLKVEYDETNARRLLVRVTPDGLMRAERLSAPVAKSGFVEKLVSERSQKLINVGNFMIAFFALVVAAIALLRTN